MEHLSERTVNVCQDESLNTLFKIINFYYKYGDFTMIKNCGEKTNNELVTLAQKYLIQYKLTPVALAKYEENILFDRFKFFCFERFNIPSADIEEYKKEFFACKFQFFKFMLLVLKRQFNEREFFILETNSGFFKEKKKLTLQSIGDQFEITRERVRQISQKIPVDIEIGVLRFLNEINYIHNHFNYHLNAVDDFILINSSVSDAINKAEKLNFTPRFYAFIFSLLSRNTYQLIPKGFENDKNFYLIKNELAVQFDFNLFFNDLNARIHGRNDHTYKLLLDAYLLNFMKTSDLSIANQINKLCRMFIINELKLDLMDDQAIVVKRNTLKRLSEHIIEILNDKGRPLHLIEIRKELARRTIKTPPNIESLRSSILTIKKIKPIGKTSTYSLKNWSYIQTGTIKKMVFEFLQKYDEPKTIHEISHYINQFRKTNHKNIRTNLRLDKNHTFQFFQKGYIGLCSKKYNLNPGM